MSKPIKILINSNDETSFLKANEYFLDELKKLYESFKKDYRMFNKKYSNFYKNNSQKNFYIDLERKKYVSPITIFDADWGMGKTYFFEKLIENCFINKNINLEKYNFKKIIAIDLWDYINSDEMVNEIVYDLYTKLVPKDQKLKIFLKKALKNGIKISSIYLANLFTNGNLGLSITMNNDNNNDIKKIKKTLEKIENTIIIFDNVERLENKSFEVIKLIQKITHINNLLIILPMNKNKFLNDKKSNENKIDKYITLDNYFYFEQDFQNLLKNKNIDNEYIETINNLLKCLVDNQNITIRNLEKKLNIFNSSLNYSFEKSKYHGLIFLHNKIWSCKDFVIKIILTDIDEIVYLYDEFLKYYSNWRENNRNLIYNSYNSRMSVNVWIGVKEIFDSLNSKRNLTKFLFLKENVNEKVFQNKKDGWIFYMDFNELKEIKQKLEKKLRKTNMDEEVQPKLQKILSNITKIINKFEDSLSTEYKYLLKSLIQIASKDNNFNYYDKNWISRKLFEKFFGEI